MELACDEIMPLGLSTIWAFLEEACRRKKWQGGRERRRASKSADYEIAMDSRPFFIHVQETRNLRLQKIKSKKC
jgi:hypothetical protein